jgi:hypothetical protein
VRIAIGILAATVIFWGGQAMAGQQPVSDQAPAASQPAKDLPLAKDDGYRGIWYMNQPSGDEYKYKYSGGFATYPQQHVPIAVYSKEAQKTFFVYGGRPREKNELLHMVSYFDHATGRVPRPRILLNKRTDDAHENPVLAIDDRGVLWIFSPTHGSKGETSFIHKGTAPYSIDAFQRVYQGNFSYPQPWHIPGEGFLFLHTRYDAGKSVGIAAQRLTHWMTSPDSLAWGEPQRFVGIEKGDYQISWRDGNRVGVVFDYHPAPVGLNARANIYYLETRDLGKTWQTIDGKPVQTPITAPDNPALVYNSRADKLLVYLKDLAFDAEGRPVILFLTSKGYESGPKNDPRTWRTARWTGTAWEFRPFTTSTNNYDHGSLYIEPDGAWRVIAPTAPGPQAYNPGGEMVMWISRDRGAAWQKVRQLTSASPRNHTYARRPVNAHPDFYALWADGNAREPSESCLYFTNQTGDHVWRLPTVMKDDFATPEVAW